MKFTAEKSQLQNALGKVVGAVDRTTTMQVLGCVLVETSALRNTVTVTASDLEVFASASITVSGEMESARFCVPALRLKGAVDACPEEDVTLTHSGENEILITSGSARFQFAVLPADEYPAAPEPEGVACVLPPGLIGRIVKAVGHAVSKDETRWNFHGICLACEEAGRLTAVATDGYRLSLVAVDYDQAAAFGEQIILPPKPARLVSGLFGRLDCGRSEEGSVLHFDADSERISARRVDAEFPDFRRVIPSGYDKSVHVDSDALVQALEACGVVAEGKSKAVTLRTEGEILAVSALGSEGRVSVDVPFDGDDDFEISVNAAYFIQALKSLGGEVFLKFRDKMHPLLAIPVDHQGWDERLEVLMPIQMGS